MGRDTAATVAITRHPPEGGYQTVFSCPAHVLRTIRELGGQGLTVGTADGDVHRCKGCDAAWLPDARLAG